MQAFSQVSDRVCHFISKQFTGSPSGSNHQWILCQILNSRMSLKLQCWFYKSQIMFGKVKGSWSFTWKRRYSNSSHGLFSFSLSLSCYWPCLPRWGEGSPDLCWQSLTVGEKYIPGGRTAFNKKHSISLHLTHSTLGLPPPLLCSNIRSEAHVEACWSQMLSKTPAQLCWGGKQDSRQMHGRAKATEKSWRHIPGLRGVTGPHSSGSQGCRSYSCVSKALGNVFLVGPFSFLGYVRSERS